MKSIALLTTALFLASAPSPDSATISEMSAGFLSAGKVQPLLAAEPDQAKPGTDTKTSIATDADSAQPASDVDG
jgi:hypothetical protein